MTPDTVAGPDFRTIAGSDAAIKAVTNTMAATTRATRAATEGGVTKAGR